MCRRGVRGGHCVSKGCGTPNPEAETPLDPEADTPPIDRMTDTRL